VKGDRKGAERSKPPRRTSVKRAARPNSVARKKHAEVVDGLLNEVRNRVQKGELKPTLGDYIRLMQLKRELDENEPKNVEVKWVDPEKKDG